MRKSEVKGIKIEKSEVENFKIKNSDIKKKWNREK